jgi:hypothetical protein
LLIQLSNIHITMPLMIKFLFFFFFFILKFENVIHIIILLEYVVASLNISFHPFTRLTSHVV